MIPYITIPPINIYHNFNIHIFGLLLYLGICFGCFVSYRDARKYNLDTKMMILVMYVVVINGFIFSYLFTLLFYFPERLIKNPLLIFDFSQILKSMSSIGGFFGGILGLFIFTKLKKISFLKYADNLALAVSVGRTFGRFGCALVHDHPGQFSNFILAVNFPDGSRHDLGLYEFFFQIIITSILFVIRKKIRTPGFLFGAWLILYMFVRFLFDFLRTNDHLYFGLTPGQYWCMIGFIGGLYIVRLCLLRQNQTHLPNQKEGLVV